MLDIVFYGREKEIEDITRILESKPRYIGQG